MKINLGCGNIYMEGYVNCDISKNVKADKYFDAREGLPFKDNEAEEIIVGCILEQICSNEDFIKVLNELWRVLESGGKLKGYVPNADFSCAFQDPMDCRRFNEQTWNYFNVDDNLYKEFGSNYGFKPWRDIDYKTNESGIMHFIMSPNK